ncbi:hypothetical protein P3T27_004537, partial [Kitasatospora sp. MAA19]|nr:hypothetical protein [Kitasatospora sp. MAA19]
MAHSSMNVSPGVATFFHILTGMPWPESNEGALRDVRDEYATLAEELPQLKTYIADLVAACRKQFEGEAAEAFEREMGRFIGDGSDTDYVGVATELCKQLSGFAGKVANTVEYTKWMIVGQIIQLLIEIALAIFWSPFTGGASLLAVEPGKQVVKTIIINLLKKLLQVILMHTFFGVVGGLVMDGIIQGIQFGRGDRHEWDKDLTKQAAIFGAISGVIAGPLHLLGMGLGKLFGKMFGKLFVSKELSASLKSLATGLAKGGAKDLEKLGAKELANLGAKELKNLGSKELGNLGGKEAGNLGGKEAGSGAGRAIGDKTANEFANSLDKILREHSNYLSKGFAAAGKTGAKAGSQFTKSMAEAFEKHLGAALGKDLARELGTKFGKEFAEKWAKSPGARAGLAATLREIANSSKIANGELRVLAEKLPELAGRVDKMNKMFVLGHALGEQVKMGVNQYLSEGFYNLIFEPNHEFSASGSSFLAGFLMGGARHLLHGVTSPLMTKYVNFVRDLQHADIPHDGSKYFHPLHPLTLLSVATNLSGHAVPFPVPRLGERLPAPAEGGAHLTSTEGGGHTPSLTPPSGSHRTDGGPSTEGGSKTDGGSTGSKSTVGAEAPGGDKTSKPGSQTGTGGRTAPDPATPRPTESGGDQGKKTGGTTAPAGGGEPNKPLPNRPDPSKPLPDRPDPSKPDPIKPDPIKPDPSKPLPDRPDPNRPDPIKPDPSKPLPDRPDPNRPDPIKSDPNKPLPDRPDPNRPDPKTPDPNPDHKPGPIKPDPNPDHKPGPKTPDPNPSKDGGGDGPPPKTEGGPGDRKDPGPNGPDKDVPKSEFELQRERVREQRLQGEADRVRFEEARRAREAAEAAKRSQADGEAPKGPEGGEKEPLPDPA